LEEERHPEAVPSAIVGIGASAGGLESLEQLFDGMPNNTGMAFVVIQHLSPDFKSLMDELLARHSDMPIVLAQDEMQIVPNHVYLMPPRKEMTVRNGLLWLTDKDPSTALTRPIDLFFRSLAQDAGPRAIAVVLSGSGSDGSRALQEIKAAGGLVIVETPESAKFDGMPISAIATGTADHVCAPRGVASAILNRSTSEGATRTDVPLDETPMAGILRRLRDTYGIDFNLYKEGTVTRRIERRLALHGSRDIDSYLAQLATDSEELELLYLDLLIGVTRFMRDPEAFSALERIVIPEILQRVPPGEEIRAWVPGCATGEEAFSLAMLLFEQLTAADRPMSVKILATDVHRESLEKASHGFYRREQLIHISPSRLSRFFVKRRGGYQVSQDLRNLIVFAPHDVIKDAPFTKMNLISCRNLLIYFEPPTQKSVLSMFHFGLVSSGILFLGSSESTGAIAGEFIPIDDKWKIFRKRRDIRLLDQVKLPIRAGVEKSIALSKGLASDRIRGATEDRQLLNLYDSLLDRCMPPSFLIDEDGMLLDSFGGAEKYLRVRARRPTRSLLPMLDGEFRSIVGGAIQRARTHGEAVRYEAVRLPNGLGRCTLTAERLRTRSADASHVIVSLLDATNDDGAESRPRAAPTEANDAAGVGVSQVASAEHAVREHVDRIEEELSFTRETLQATIEELETSNEELQAANEELVASNEELQSTNEELHSVNEELYTVNAEHQKKIEELAEVSRDIQHLLDGTDVGTLYLDGDLRIRKFTPRITSIFRVLPQDVGRKLNDFTHNIDRESLLEEIARVHKERIRVEEKVTDASGTSYFLRILPYIAHVDADSHEPAEGVVLTLTDISALEKARAQVAELSSLVESSDDAIVGVDLDGTITSWNVGAERLYGRTAAEAVGHSWAVLLPQEPRGEHTRILGAVRSGKTVDQRVVERVRADGVHVHVDIKFSPIRDRAGAVVGASAIARDVSQLRSTQHEVLQREERIRLLLDSTAEAIFGIDPAGVITFSNPACARIFGFASAKVLVGTSSDDIMRMLGDRPAWALERCRVLADGKTFHLDDGDLARADGTVLPVEVWARPIHRDEVVVGAVVTVLDATHRRRVQEEMHTAAMRRDHFLAMLSHELRNPLAAVLNATEVISLYDKSTTWEQLESAKRVIERQSRHMARLLEDLLDVSRITRGKFPLRVEELEVGERIRVALESLVPLQQERGVSYEYVPAPTKLPMRGDSARIQQVIGNLVSNAVRYSERGSTVYVEASREGSNAVVRVRDRGCGIDPEILPKIFDLFVQADQHLDRHDGGLGVGLTLVAHIVSAHGGRVEAFSAGVGNGSEFVVYLPLDVSPRTALTEPDSEEEPMRPRKIVIVEDQDDSREMFRLLLEARGHEVREANDGPSGVEVITRERPDIAFVDIGLPTMSGFEVAKAIRSAPALGAVTLVALSGYGADSDVQKAREAGFDAHITKPADLRRLEAFLQNLGPE